MVVLVCFELGARFARLSRVGGRTEVTAHPDYLFRSLVSVVRNAISYRGEFDPIAISANEKDGVVSITVADSGPSLPAMELAEVFEPFYGPEPAQQWETDGVGLGLAIVKTCTRACGGIVKCRNRSPTGLEVEIRLPAPEP